MAQKAQKNVEKITLTVSDTDFKFTIGRTDYNGYLNSITPSNKVAPHHNLLVGTVDEEDRDALVEFLKNNPGAEMALGGELISAYTPDLDVVVKKSSSAQSE